MLRYGLNWMLWTCVVVFLIAAGLFKVSDRGFDATVCAMLFSHSCIALAALNLGWHEGWCEGWDKGRDSCMDPVKH